MLRLHVFFFSVVEKETIHKNFIHKSKNWEKKPSFRRNIGELDDEQWSLDLLIFFFVFGDISLIFFFGDVSRMEMSG